MSRRIWVCRAWQRLNESARPESQICSIKMAMSTLRNTSNVLQAPAKQTLQQVDAQEHQGLFVAIKIHEDKQHSMP